MSVILITLNVNKRFSLCFVRNNVPPRVSLAILFLYIHIFVRCVKSRETFIISEKLVEKHIIVDVGPVQDIPYGDVLYRFNIGSM